jgi:hypothetical protein
MWYCVFPDERIDDNTTNLDKGNEGHELVAGAICSWKRKSQLATGQKQRVETGIS